MNDKAETDEWNDLDEKDQLIMALTVHLLAAISLLETIHQDVPKNKKHALFNTKIADYKMAAQKGRVHILDKRK